MGAHFVANVLKYNKKSSNFGSRRLVTESPFLTLLQKLIFFNERSKVRKVNDACISARGHLF